MMFHYHQLKKKCSDHFEVSLTTVNWHCGEHFPEYIEEFGVPNHWRQVLSDLCCLCEHILISFSTQRGEARHRDLKQWKECQNNHKIYR